MPCRALPGRALPGQDSPRPDCLAWPGCALRRQALPCQAAPALPSLAMRCGPGGARPRLDGPAWPCLAKPSERYRDCLAAPRRAMPGRDERCLDCLAPPGLAALCLAALSDAPPSPDSPALPGGATTGNAWAMPIQDGRCPAMTALRYPAMPRGASPRHALAALMVH